MLLRRSVVASLLVCVLLPALAWAEKPVKIDHVDYDAVTQELTIHADVLNAEGEPVDELDPIDLEILASDKQLEITEMTAKTSEDAGEPVAIMLLINGARAYQLLSEGEEFTAFRQGQEGASQFLDRLGDNDKVAIAMYHQGSIHEQIYAFGSSFKQARDAVMAAKVEDVYHDAATQEGLQARPRTLEPDLSRAVKEAVRKMGDAIEDADRLGNARRRYLLIMSDGKDRITDKAKLMRKAEAVLDDALDYRIRIMAIGYSADDQKYLSVLQTLADGTGGVYRKIDPKDFSTIPTVWDRMALRIKRQYVIKAKLAELPDHGERIKGRDEARYNVTLKVKRRDGQVDEASLPDVKLPLAGFDWKAALKWTGIVLGGLLGLFLVIFGIRKLAAGRSGGGQQVVQEQFYDGPDRGKLHVLGGPYAGEVFPLIDDVTTIGSMKGNTIVLEDGSVSRRHCAIKIDQMRYEIADMGSTNGTLVNGARVHKVFLKDGDRIAVGSTEIQFRLK